MECLSTPGVCLILTDEKDKKQTTKRREKQLKNLELQKTIYKIMKNEQINYMLSDARCAQNILFYKKYLKATFTNQTDRNF